MNFKWVFSVYNSVTDSYKIVIIFVYAESLVLKRAKLPQWDLCLPSQFPAKTIGQPLFGHTVSLSLPRKNSFAKVFLFWVQFIYIL